MMSWPRQTSTPPTRFLTVLHEIGVLAHVQFDAPVAQLGLAVAGSRVGVSMECLVRLPPVLQLDEDVVGLPSEAVLNNVDTVDARCDWVLNDDDVLTKADKHTH